MASGFWFKVEGSRIWQFQVSGSPFKVCPKSWYLTCTPKPYSYDEDSITRIGDSGKPGVPQNHMSESQGNSVGRLIAELQGILCGSYVPQP